MLPIAPSPGNDAPATVFLLPVYVFRPRRAALAISGTWAACQSRGRSSACPRRARPSWGPRSGRWVGGRVGAKPPRASKRSSVGARRRRLASWLAGWLAGWRAGELADWVPATRLLCSALCLAMQRLEVLRWGRARRQWSHDMAAEALSASPLSLSLSCVLSLRLPLSLPSISLKAGSFHCWLHASLLRRVLDVVVGHIPCVAAFFMKEYIANEGNDCRFTVQVRV
jgi:hypothetical protein